MLSSSVYHCMFGFIRKGVSYSLYIPYRFGVPASSSTSDNTEEDAKKKARLARFGKDTKVDSAEEDKRKARALRYFSIHPKCVSTWDFKYRAMFFFFNN